ncbi:MAG: T9SS type A sorting domain-containing protein, partial [Bacteroidetes bacterium]|nr:T9SS type A sorting domain-containing protein [Bacteroidota bacterium]
KNPSHTYTYGNKYSVSLVSTSDFGCSDTASKMHFINVTSSLAELDDSEPRIYPNPTTNELFIEYANLIQDISIINELGEIVLKRSDVKQKSYHFDFLDLDAGLYLVKTMDINGSVYWSKLTIM